MSDACGPISSCRTLPIAAGEFSLVTLFRFRFSLPFSAFLNITHDDGVSLFPAEMTSGDLHPIEAADVTGPRTDATLSSLDRFVLYDLWYLEAGAGSDPLPAVLQTSAFIRIIDVPEPASLALLSSGLLAAWVGSASVAAELRKTLSSINRFESASSILSVT